MRHALPSLLAVLFALPVAAAEPLPNTKPLTRDGDLAAQMVEGIDKYLMREWDAAAKRPDPWKIDADSQDAYQKATQHARERLCQTLGVVDARVPLSDLEYVGGPRTPSLVADAGTYRVHAVRWPVLAGVDGEGLLLEPQARPVANVILLPDADQTPETVVGLAPGLPKTAHLARRLAEGGCRVLVPVLIDRKDDYSGNPKLGRRTNQPHREFLYRMAYEMGRHPLGYEVQKVLAGVDWFVRDRDHAPIGVFGYGEGGLVALFAGAIDERITATGASGVFYTNYEQPLWEQPLYRNVWGLQRDRFLDRGQLGLLCRRLVLEESLGPMVDGPPAGGDGRRGAAPGRIFIPEAVRQRLSAPDRDARGSHPKSRRLVYTWGQKGDVLLERADVCPRGGAPGSVWAEGFFRTFLRPKRGSWAERKEEAIQAADRAREGRATDPPRDLRPHFDPAPRQKRQFDQLVAYTQGLMRDSEAERAATFWAKLDTSSPEKYAASTEPFRKQLWEEVIGKLPAPTKPMNPRTRRVYDEPRWTGYEVTLDLYPDVFAYGILLLPKGMRPEEKRPVVVCQHGLEGRPTDVVNPKERTRYYNSFGARLADRGYIVYAPQNPYIGQDRFRVLQRKANPLGLSLFSFILRQHERTLDWLATLPNVNADRIGFYGLSYGGKTAMRVPAVLPRYCLSVCSGDFNEWTWKNVSVDFRGSYLFSDEYEMPEFNLGHTLGYAEMAALIAPRPFMVERGHEDGVGIDEWVALEYAKVRRLYSRLKLPEQTEIEFFAGGHEIHGQGAFRFLDKHLK